MNIVVVGLGRLGLPMLAVLTERNHNVLGLDTNEERINSLNRGECYIPEPDLDWMLANYRPPYSTDYLDASGADVVFIVVNTPPAKDKSLDRSQIVSALTSLNELAHPPKVVVVTSTTQPGDMQNLADSFPDLELVYQPQFIALGTVIRDLKRPDIALYGGPTPKTLRLLQRVWKPVYKNKPRQVMTNYINAEMIKLSLNAYLCTKIAFANSLADYCEQTLDADASLIIRALNLDRRVDTAYMKPGMGYGGTCFPKDIEAFNHALEMRVNGYLTRNLPFLNDYHNRRFAKLAAGCRTAAILGLSYKPNVPVPDRSPAHELMCALRDLDLRIYDPCITDIPLPEGIKIVICSSLEEALDSAEIAFICSPYPEFRNLKFEGKVVDCCGFTREVDTAIHLWKAGKRAWRKSESLSPAAAASLGAT